MSTPGALSYAKKGASGYYYTIHSPSAPSSAKLCSISVAVRCAIHAAATNSAACLLVAIADAAGRRRCKQRMHLLSIYRRHPMPWWPIARHQRGLLVGTGGGPVRLRGVRPGPLVPVRAILRMQLRPHQHHRLIGPRHVSLDTDICPSEKLTPKFQNKGKNREN